MRHFKDSFSKFNAGQSKDHNQIELDTLLREIEQRKIPSKLLILEIHDLMINLNDKINVVEKMLRILSQFADIKKAN